MTTENKTPSSNVGLLRKLGIYINEAFITDEQCDAFVSDIKSNNLGQSTVFNDERGGGLVLSDVRQSSTGKVSDANLLLAKNMLDDELVAIENYFDFKLHQENPTPRFYVYGKGDFFSLHDDDRFGRTINISVYLNQETNTVTEEGYCGGQLTFHGLLPGVDPEKYGLPVFGKKGMLVAYRSNVKHQVTEVLNGCRYAMVQFLLKN